MSTKAARWPHSTNFQLSTEQRERLGNMAGEEGVDMSVIVRSAIDARWRHKFENRPHCADAQTCRCPQLHQIIQAPQPLSTADSRNDDPTQPGPSG